MERRVVSFGPSSGGSLPLSPAVSAGPFVFVSGQVAVDRSTSKFVGGGVTEQTHQVLRNVREILAAAGSSLEQVVKVGAFLSDLKEFSAFNEVYRTYFPTDPPARTTIQAVLIPPYAVEIDVVALRSEGE